MKFRNQHTFKGHEISNVRNKPLLHKKGKQWVVVAVSALILAGFGGLAATTTNADTVNANGNKPSTTANMPKATQPSAPQKPATTNVQGNGSKTATTTPSNPQNTTPKVTPSAPVNPSHRIGALGSVREPSATTPVANPAHTLGVAAPQQVATGKWNADASSATWNLYNNGLFNLHDGTVTGGWPSGLNTSQIKYFHTSNITNRDGLPFGNETAWNIFSGDSAIKDIDLSGLPTNWTVSGNWGHGFCSIPNVVNINLGHPNTSGNHFFDTMFADDTSLQHIEGLQYFDTNNTTNMSNMFYDCPQLRSLDLSSFNTTHVNNSQPDYINGGVHSGNYNIFRGDTHLSSLALGANDKFQPDSGISPYAFIPNTDLATTDPTQLDNGQAHPGVWNIYQHGNWGTANWYLSHGTMLITSGTLTQNQQENNLLASTGMTPAQANSVTHIKLVGDVRVPNGSSNSRLFDDEAGTAFNNLQSIDVKHLDTSNVSDFLAMFCGLKGLRHIENLPTLNMSNATNEMWMFAWNPQLQSLDLSNANFNYDSDNFMGDNQLSKLTLGPRAILHNDPSNNNVSFLQGAGATDLNGTDENINQLENGEPHPGTWYIYKDSGQWNSAKWYLLNNGKLELVNGTLTDSSHIPSSLLSTANNVTGIVTHNVTAPENASGLFNHFTNAKQYGIDLRGVDFNGTNNLKHILPADTQAEYNNSFNTALDNQETTDDANLNQAITSLSGSDATALAQASANASNSAAQAKTNAEDYTNGRTTSLDNRIHTDEGSLTTAYTKATNAIDSLAAEDTRISANSNSAISFSNELAKLSTSAAAAKDALITDEQHISTNTNNIGNLSAKINNDTTNLDNAIGNINTMTDKVNTNTDNIAVNGGNINTNAKHINTNAANINTNAEDIDTNAFHINKNSASASTAISHNADSIATNSQNISNNTANINTNSTSASNAIAHNAANINTNSGNISANGSNINKNSTSASNAIAHNAANINTNSGSISANTSNINKNSTSASNAISHNAANINTNSGNISANTSNINKNSTSASNAIAHNAANINTNSGSISANGSNIAKNSTSASNAIAHNAANIHTNSGNISANGSNITKNSTSASNAIAHNAANIHTNSGNISANTSNINKNSASASTATSSNASNIAKNSKADSQGISQDSKNASISASAVNSNDNSNAYSWANSATGVANNNAFGLDMEMNSDEQNVNSLSGTVNNNTASLANGVSSLSASKVNKPAPVHYNTFYINVLKPVWLYKGTRFTKRNRAKKLNSGYTLRVKPVKSHKANLLEAMVNGKRYFLMNHNNLIQKTYIQPTEIKRNQHVEAIRPMKEYKDPYFTRHSTIRIFKRGTVLTVKRCITITHTHMTRLQLTNGHWITSNRKYIRIRRNRSVRKAYIQPRELRGKHYIRVVKPLREYRTARFGRRAIRVFKRGSVLHIKQVKTINHSHLTRLQLTNGRWITANKRYVKAYVL